MKTFSSQKNSSEEIIIPDAIPRYKILSIKGPTDILKALASIVEKDHTAPHYRFVDDPYLTPVTNIDKRSYALAKESGRIAARYFVETYPDLFFRDYSEPKIEAFTYKEIYEESMDFEIDDLRKSISRCDVRNSIICYQKLSQLNIEIDQCILLDLLDLVCFYNCEDEQLINEEENFFQRQKIPIKNIWKDNGFAENLFETIRPKSDRTYSAIIMGMAKHHQNERAFAYYRQAIDSNMRLNTLAFNALIDIVQDMHIESEKRWETIENLLKTMALKRLKPDLGTLNSTLRQLSRFKFWNRMMETTSKVFNELAFKFGIEPSLATYLYLLRIFYRSKNSQSSLIYDIMHKIGQRRFEPKDGNDGSVSNEREFLFQKKSQTFFTPTFLRWTTKSLSLCLSILNKNQEMEFGWRIIKKMCIIPNLLDEPDSKALIEYCLNGIKSKNHHYTINCLNCCKKIGKSDVIDSIKKELQTTTLNANIRYQSDSVFPNFK
ncbi:PTCD3-like protein, mitochondrial-like protein [Sarcoptes scabiei]|uniref:PTCD3-like protein, mitochondrial-like protein n=1 Tax=Sarcoptes scabiei TaxID=52283 RepID=A0A132A2U6_SARSC|nr:PTCD3-like protein, mitochondrial-like protein [Sarcoptes scabiei]